MLPGHQGRAPPPEDEPPPGGFPPWGDDFSGPGEILSGRTATGTNGGWVWGAWGDTGWQPSIAHDASAAVGIDAGQAGNFNNSARTPNMGNVYHWCEVQVAALPSANIAFGPAINVDDYEIAGTVQGYIFSLRTDGRFDFWRQSGIGGPALIGTQGNVGDTQFQVGDYIGFERADDSFLVVYRNRPMDGGGGHVGWAQMSSPLAGQCAGFVAGLIVDTGGVGWYSNFVADAGLYPYR